MNNNNKICNPKTEVPTGESLNDKDYVNSLLSSLKDMTKNYALVMTDLHLKTIMSLQLQMFHMNFA